MRILSCPEETLRLQCKRCPIFKKLSDEEFATFLPGVTLVEYAKQDLIMDEDADADCCFMVISGHVRDGTGDPLAESLAPCFHGVYSRGQP